MTFTHWPVCGLSPGPAAGGALVGTTVGVLVDSDVGVLLVQADQPGRAIDHLRHYLGAAPDADDARDVQNFLSKALAERKVYEFALVINPPRLRGATGAPVNAFAILPQ